MDSEGAGLGIMKSTANRANTTIMARILDVIQGPRKGRSFVFDRHDTFIVGRSRSVHCPMPEDGALSRDHFLIEINPPRSGASFGISRAPTARL